MCQNFALLILYEEKLGYFPVGLVVGLVGNLVADILSKTIFPWQDVDTTDILIGRRGIESERGGSGYHLEYQGADFTDFTFGVGHQSSPHL